MVCQYTDWIVGGLGLMFPSLWVDWGQILIEVAPPNETCKLTDAMSITIGRQNLTKSLSI